MSTATLPQTPLQNGCPSWCIEHYVGEGGTHNHAGSADRSVIGAGTNTSLLLEIGVWPELRRAVNGRATAVGIIQIGAIDSGTGRQPEDIELTGQQLRDLAAHLLAVAAEVDTAR